MQTECFAGQRSEKAHGYSREARASGVPVEDEPREDTARQGLAYGYSIDGHRSRAL
jgi:hypothetical protein